tara:strand:- start:74 stop:517 length:444 start_codon:yes stop_codon:yes gene_type:complete
MTQIPSVVKVISTLGLFPFLVGVVATLKISILHPDLNKFLIDLSILYGALILSFLGGCLFGFECLNKPVSKTYKYWVAILPSLWALLALQIANFSASILAIGFLLVFEADRRAHATGVTPNWWLSLRLPLTATVILSLTIIGFNHAD